MTGQIGCAGITQKRRHKLGVDIRQFREGDLRPETLPQPLFRRRALLCIGFKLGLRCHIERWAEGAVAIFSASNTILKWLQGEQGELS